MVTPGKIQKTKQKNNKKKNAQPCKLLFRSLSTYKRKNTKKSPFSLPKVNI